MLTLQPRTTTTLTQVRCIRGSCFGAVTAAKTRSSCTAAKHCKGHLTMAKAQKNDNSIFEEAEDGYTHPIADNYVVLNGLKYVRPYHFDFVMNIKRRQKGKTLVELFLHEFPQRSREYYERAVSEGRLRQMLAPPDQQGLVPLKEGEVVRHFVHRHEPPVMDIPVELLYHTPEVVVVSKPPSMPVHHAGQYRKNTVVGHLAAFHNITDVKPVHRLDRNVSGLLVMARTAKKADEFRAQIEGHGVRKYYVARVLGTFPEEEVECTAPLAWDARAGQTIVGSIAEGGKEARTKFRRLSVAEDGRTSVVECMPLTGRTHQIRVHLQHLKHPIANDVKYGGDGLIAFAHSPIKLDISCPEIPEGEVATPGHSEPSDECEVSHRVDYMGAVDSVGVAADSMCPHCPWLAPEGWDPAEVVPLWLHAHKYSGEGWEYVCPLPAWAGAAFAVAAAAAAGLQAPAVVMENIDNINRKRMRVV